MISVNEIRSAIASYLANDISFAQFEDWLIDHSWNMHKDSPVEAQDFVHAINASIYEYLDKYVDENYLKVQLRPHVQQYRVAAANVSVSPLYRPSSSSGVERRQLAYG
jgi:hypothetical protein